MPGASWAALSIRLATRAVLNPMLALELAGVVWAFRRRNWWATPPFLPVPDHTYLRWRMYTAYGDEAAVPPIEEVIRFARWRRQLMRLNS